MRARSFSHVGITVRDFNTFVRFYWDVFGCPLVGVADTPPDRVRAFFAVDAPAPRCKIGWIRVPGGAVLEIFHFEPQQPAIDVPWNRVGQTHFSLNVRNTHRWHDYLVSKGVQIVTKPAKRTVAYRVRRLLGRARSAVDKSITVVMKGRPALLPGLPYHPKICKL